MRRDERIFLEMAEEGGCYARTYAREDIARLRVCLLQLEAELTEPGMLLKEMANNCESIATDIKKDVNDLFDHLWGARRVWLRQQAEHGE